MEAAAKTTALEAPKDLEGSKDLTPEEGAFPVVVLDSGLKVVIYRPAQYQNRRIGVKTLVEQDIRERALDLILWPNQAYSIKPPNDHSF